MDSAKIMKRNEVPKEFTWATEDIFASDEAWQAEYEAVAGIIDKMADYKGKITTTAENLYNYLEAEVDLNVRIGALYGYSGRKNDEDTSNPKYRQMIGTMSNLSTKAGSVLAFANPELMQLTDEQLKRYYEEFPKLKLYERKLELMLKKKPHILSEAEENLLALTTKMCNAPDDIFSTLSDTDAKFPDIKDSEGNTVAITHGSYGKYIEDKDRRVRRDAYNSLYTVYKQYKNTLASVLDAQINQLSFVTKARKYRNNLEAALSGTEVPEEVYHNLINSVHDNMHYMHRYMALRKKLLKVDELHMYDLFVPIVEKPKTEITFEEAKKTVYDALEPLGDNYRSVLKEGFENRWIDVYENEGKRSGAYSSGQKVHPFVLLNYNNTLDSEFTLIHEMGHALHSYFSNKTQHPAYSGYKIFVAEVASTCNEALLMRYLLKNTDDKRERAALINHFLDDFRTTLYRQTMFAEFELKINNMVESGETLTADALNKIYHDLNVLYYGPEMVVDENIDVEWARIPHFYYDYYVYQYATGYSAAIALSEKILNEGTPAVENYLKFLSSGGSADPISLLKIAGVDMGTPEPVNKALKVFGELIDELEKIVDEL